MKYKIRINPVAISDIQEIKAYISEDNPSAAAGMGNDIYSKLENLAEFPQLGVSLNSRINIKTDYRFLVCGMYLIFYINIDTFMVFDIIKNNLMPLNHILANIINNELSKGNFDPEEYEAAKMSHYYQHIKFE